MTCDRNQFIKYLKLLQPDKTWTQKKETYWFRDHRPIRGILAKLVAGARTNPRRFKVIKKLAPGFTIRPEATVEQKKRAMLRALREKFRHPQYGDLLLSSGYRALHEKPMRGNGSNSLWTYKVDTKNCAHGGDLLGKLLMQVRQELAEPTPSFDEPTQSLVEPTPSFDEPTQSLAEPTPSPTPSHKRRRTPDGEDVIDLTGDTPPANKQAAKESTKESDLANDDDDERKAVATVMGIIQRVYDDANNRLDTGRPIADTPVSQAVVGVARAMNSLYTDFAGPYLTSFGNRWTEVGAQETLACMDDRDDSRSFAQLLRAVSDQ
jgi:predicted NAD-dependent protein-ADP-ribosyltransferase YbiA (DUF1768 family)